jgi:hypothetical protein
MQGTVEAFEAPIEELTNSSDTKKVPTWIRDARRIVAQSDTDFFKVSPLRYWTDFLFSLVCAYSAAMVYLLSPRSLAANHCVSNRCFLALPAGFLNSRSVPPWRKRDANFQSSMESSCRCLHANSIVLLRDITEITTASECTVRLKTQNMLLTFLRRVIGRVLLATAFS